MPRGCLIQRNLGIESVRPAGAERRLPVAAARPIFSGICPAGPADQRRKRMASVDRSMVVHLPLFAGLAAGELDALLKEARAVRHPKNSHVFEQGREAHSFFVLLHGYVRAEKATPDGGRIVVRYISAGEVFGVAEAIGLKHYPATAVAAVDSVSLAWPSAAWPRLVAQHPPLATNTLKTVGERLQQAHTRIVEMTTDEVERRVARALLQLVDQAGRKVEGANRNRLSHQPPGRRQDDGHHAAHRQPHSQRLGTARIGRERPSTHHRA